MRRRRCGHRTQLAASNQWLPQTKPSGRECSVLPPAGSLAPKCSHCVNGQSLHSAPPPRHRPATSLHRPGTPLHSTPQTVTPLRRPATPLHSTLEVAPENPRHATHFIKENENGLANKLRGPSSLPPASNLFLTRNCKVSVAKAKTSAALRPMRTHENPCETHENP